MNVMANEHQKKPLLRVVATINEGYTNEDGTGLYWNIIEEVFKDHYQIVKTTTHWNKAKNLVSSQLADVLIGVTSKEEDFFTLSSSHIDRSYPLYAIYQSEQFTINTPQDLENLAVAIRKHSSIDNLLPNNIHGYFVDSVYQVDKLISNSRVDIAVAYAFNKNLTSKSKQLTRKVILPKQKLYVGFPKNDKGKMRQKEFDQAMKKALKEDRIAKLFPSALKYQHANYFDNQKEKTLKWNLEPRLFNEKTNRLEVLQREIDYSEYLSKQLSQYNFQFESMPYKQTLVVEPNTTICSLTLKQPKHKDAELIFSQPAHVFIRPKLFFLNENIPSTISHLMDDNASVDIHSLLNDNAYLQIAITRNSNIHTSLKGIVNKQSLSRLHIIDDLNYKSMVSLLLAKRIDAFIAWPSMVGELLDNKSDIEQFRSLALKQKIGDNVFSFITCSKTTEGERLIDQINAIISTPKHQTPLYQQSLKQLDQDTKADFISLLKLAL